MSGYSLMYHRVQKSSDRCLFPDPNSYLSVSEETFRRQLRHLKKRYKFLTADEVLELSGALPRRTLFLTFDDGYRDNFDTVAPILSDMGIPAVFFVTTGFIDRTVHPWWYALWDFCMSDKTLIVNLSAGILSCVGVGPRVRHAHSLFRKLSQRAYAMAPADLTRFSTALAALSKSVSTESDFMTWEQVRKLCQTEVFSIAGHTASHACVDVMNQDEIISDLLESRRRFSDEAVNELNLFAYPVGRINESASLAVRQVGYDVTWIADGRRPAGLSRNLSLPRLGIANHHSPWEIEARLALREATAGRLPS